ncbi:MAG: hypothetical protein HGB19_04935 [Chlorobiales bacterium]|jgi:hypothetical protein|nr:hypothetical protein [Chlorobiales bacterium]
MFEDIIRQIQDAIASSRKWAETGWSVAFGPRNIEISSLKQALALPKNSVFREEAINYWKQAELAGVDTSASGQKALDALKAGNPKAALDALYFSQFMEKPFAEFSKTWLPLYNAFKERLAGR